MAKQDGNDPDWCGYKCKSGEILFHYNKTTGEHKWEGGDQVILKMFFIVFVFSGWVVWLVKTQ